MNKHECETTATDLAIEPAGVVETQRSDFLELAFYGLVALSGVVFAVVMFASSLSAPGSYKQTQEFLLERQERELREAKQALEILIELEELREWQRLEALK